MGGVTSFFHVFSYSGTTHINLQLWVNQNNYQDQLLLFAEVASFLPFELREGKSRAAGAENPIALLRARPAVTFCGGGFIFAL